MVKNTKNKNDTPVVDTPVVDTPVVDTPADDATLFDTPVTGTPVTDVPVTDTPVVDDAPKDEVTDTPVVDAPKDDTTESAMATLNNIADEEIKVIHAGETFITCSSEVTEGDFSMAQYLVDSSRTAASGFDVDLKKTMQLFNNEPDPVVFPAYFGQQLLPIVSVASHADGLKRTAFYVDEKIQSRLSKNLAILEDLKASLNAAKYDVDFTDAETMDIIHAIWGIQSELGEISEEVIRAKIEHRDFNFENLKEEAGDILWYVALFLRTIDSTFDEVAFNNISKLKARYPQKFTTNDALDRDLEAEEKALKGE